MLRQPVCLIYAASVAFIAIRLATTLQLAAVADAKFASAANGGNIIATGAVSTTKSAHANALYCRNPLPPT
eukprot:15357707-Ditylum_brightwellii.AAC.2